jgi:hypothetical protein
MAWAGHWFGAWSGAWSGDQVAPPVVIEIVPADRFDWTAPLVTPAAFRNDPRLRRMSEQIAMVGRLRREAQRRR